METTTKHPTVSSVITASTSKTQALPKYPGSESDDEFSQYKEEDECSSSDDNSDDSHVEGNLLEDQYGDEVVLLLKKKEIRLDPVQKGRQGNNNNNRHLYRANSM